MLRIESPDIGQVIARLGVFDANQRRLVGREMREWAEIVMTESKLVCPVDTGNLRASGHVQSLESVGNQQEVILGYGGPAVDYALKVHEWIDPEPHWSTPGTGPKYLERPFYAGLKDLELRIEKALEESAKALGG